jgi:hypothetical protein
VKIWNTIKSWFSKPKPAAPAPRPRWPLGSYIGDQASGPPRPSQTQDLICCFSGYDLHIYYNDVLYDDVFSISWDAKCSPEEGTSVTGFITVVDTVPTVCDAASTYHTLEQAMRDGNGTIVIKYLDDRGYTMKRIIEDVCLVEMYNGVSIDTLYSETTLVFKARNISAPYDIGIEVNDKLYEISDYAQLKPIVLVGEDGKIISILSKDVRHKSH